MFGYVFFAVTYQVVFIIFPAIAYQTGFVPTEADLFRHG